MREYVREITLSLIAKTIRANAKLVFLLLLLVMAFIAVIYSTVVSRIPAVYVNSGLLRIDNFIPDATSERQILDTSTTTTMSVGSTLSSRSEIEAALIPTEYILGPVIKKNHLDITVNTTLLPILEQALSRFYPGSVLNNPFYKNTPYAIGYEKLEVSKLEIESQYLNRGLIVRVVDNNNYRLYLGQKYILSGTVGKLVTGAGINIQVDAIMGRPGVEFIVVKNSIDKSLADLSNLVEVEQVTSDKKIITSITGLLRISITGSDPVLQAMIVNDIMEQVQRLAQEQQAQVLSSSINFVDNEIEKVRMSLKDAQAALVSFQTSNSVINLSTQATDTINALSANQQNILENEISIVQYSSLYTKNHPLMISMYKRRDSLAANKVELEKRLNKYPKNESIYLFLKSNLDVNQQLYVFLLNKEQDLKIKASSIANPVDIISYAPSHVVPIAKKMTVKTVAELAGVSLLFISLIVMNLLFWGNSDPRMMPHLSDTPLLAVVPYFSSPESGKIQRSFELILSYLLQRYSRSNNHLVINVGSITEASGKDFILGLVIQYLNKMNKRSLFIKFGMGENYKSIPEIIRQLQQFEPNGSVEVNEFLGLEVDILSAMDESLMRELLIHLKAFDFIFLSTIPLLKSTLFLTLSALAMENILVVSPKDTRNKLELCIADFKNLGVKLDRIIFNNPKKTFIKSVYLLLYESYNQ